MAHPPRVVIVGRPNVGKSTLFNRIAGRRRALVGNEPGMTRDRLYAPAEWLGRHFEVVDTGGMIPASDDPMAQEIFRQARVAIGDADQLILLVDGRAGLAAVDEKLAGLLRRTGKPLALAVNKIDTDQHSDLVAEFHRLGIPKVFPVSAEHGLGIDDLLDHVTAGLPSETPAPAHQEASGLAADDAIRVAIIGRPNVGKSTLLNRLLNEERSIVTPAPGTTRDAVDAQLERNGQRFRLIDTAGIRRKGKTRLLAEKLSVIQARKHLERADVALLLIDAVEGVTALDTHIGGYAHESHRSIIIVVNKWDAVRKTQPAAADCTRLIRHRMKYLDYAPILFLSALRSQRLENLLETIKRVVAARRQRISPGDMERFVAETDFGRATAPAGRPFRVYGLEQTGVAPPMFVVSTSRCGRLHFSVERFLENRLRERFEFLGTPIVIKSRSRKYRRRG